MALTELQIKKAAPAEKDQRLYDTGGLFLLVTAKGAKFWRLKFQHDKKGHMMGLGRYPEVGLKDARAKRDEARILLSKGINPIRFKSEQEAVKEQATANTFQIIAEQWFLKFASKLKGSKATKSLLDKDALPWIGKLAVRDIKVAHILDLMLKIESRGALAQAHKLRRVVSQILRFAVATDRAEYDVTASLVGAIAPMKTKHHATIIEPVAVGGLLRALDGYSGSPVIKAALKLLPLVFVRSNELRYMQWSEVNFEAQEWRIPAERMKAKEQHIVPLSTQAIEILKELQPLTGSGNFIFPHVSSSYAKTRPLGENSLHAALRRLGFTGQEMSIHGFRSMASTLLNEQGWNRDAIERQLAHSERNKVRAAYNYAEFLPERRRMMQAWADYLDQLKTQKPANGGQ